MIFPYCYKPLRADDVTRVLKLHPAVRYDAPLRCELKPWRADGTAYEAVSYAWGSPTIEDRILVDDRFHCLRIRRTLGQALRALRQKTEARTLWIDALCINQQDAAEKARQVRGMSRIYSMASDVIIWLGDDHDRGSQVLSFFERYNAELMTLADAVSQHNGGQPFFRLEALTVSRYIKEGISNIFGDNGLVAFGEFFQRPWFRRRWIIQEAIMAKRAFILCGNNSTKLSTLGIGATAMNLYSAIYGGQHLLHPQFLIDEHVSDILGSIDMQNRSRNFEGVPIVGPRFPILELLSDFHAASCSDDRDRLYALVGLSDDVMSGSDDEDLRAGDQIWQSPLKMLITYSDNVQQVYTRFATSLARRSDHGPSELLHLASAFRRPPDCNSETDLPSWVPDWRVSRRFMPMRELRHLVRQRHDTTGDTKWSFAKNDRELHLYGWKYSTNLKKLHEACDFSSSTFEQMRDNFQAWLKAYLGDQLEDKLLANGGRIELDESFQNFFDWLTMERDTWLDGRFYPPVEFIELLLEGLFWRCSSNRDLRKGLLTIWADCPVDKVRQSQERKRDRQQHEEDAQVTSRMWMRSCTKTLVKLMKGRCLFRDERGNILNCPEDTRSDDVIAMLVDVDTPFILRSDRNTTTNAHTPSQNCRYSLVGDCSMQAMLQSAWMRSSAESMFPGQPIMRFEII